MAPWGLCYIATMLQPEAGPVPVKAQAPGWLERFDEFATEFFRSRGVPGGAVAIVRGGETVYARAFGLRDRERGLPARTDTIFGLASLSKSFTALTVLALQARGVLDLADPVRRHLPDFDYPGLNPDEPVRLWHLASHTAGLPPLRGLDYALYQGAADPGRRAENGRDYEGAPVIDDYAALLAYLAAPPGERGALPGPGRFVSYSNEGVALLGAVIEAATGRPFPEVFAAEVAGPLGLTGAGFDGVAAEATGRLTRFYTEGDDGTELAARDEIPAYLGTGALLASVDDLARYLTYLLRGLARGDDPRLPLPRALLAELVRGRAWSAPFTRYGLGWSIMRGFRADGGAWPGASFGPGLELVRHGGSLTGISSHQGFVPALDLGIAVLANRDDVAVSRLWTAALNAYLGVPLDSSLFPAPGPEGRPEPERARSLAGVYASGEPWGRLELRLTEDGSLEGLTGESATPGGKLALLNESEFVLVGEEGAWDGGRFHFGARGHAPVAVQLGARWYDRES